MSVLITGACGFVGSHLLERLVSEDTPDIHIIVKPTTNTRRIQPFLNRVHIHTIDITRERHVHHLVQTIRPTTIFHLAARTFGAHPRYTKPSADMLRVNIFGTHNLLKACARLKTCMFINTGSSSEYGKKDAPMREDMCIEPDTLYGISKATASHLCRQMSHSSGMPAVTLRLFSPYGPEEDAGRFIPTAFASFIAGKQPHFLSTPACVRDYIFIDDVINAYISASKNRLLAGEILNIGSGHEYTLSFVAQTIQQLCHSDIPPVWSTTKQAEWEPAHWRADIEKAKNVLGWKPNHTLEEGLRKTYRYMMKGNT